MQSLDRFFGRERQNLPKNVVHLKYDIKNISSVCNPIICPKIQKQLSSRVNKYMINPNTSQKIKKHKFINEKENNLKQALTQYFDQIIGTMLQEQNISMQPNNYLLRQTEITETMRTILLDWLVGVHHKFKMFPQTLFITVAIVDKYLSIKQIKKSELQLLGSAALYIAAKYQQTYNAPDAHQLIKISAKGYTKGDLLKMEADILAVLNFNLVFNVSLHYLQPFSKLIDFQLKHQYLAQYSLELALFNIIFLKYKPSLIAASSIFLINKINKVENCWPDVLMAASGYEEKQLRICAKQLCHLLQNASQQTDIPNLKNKFKMPKYLEVSKIKLEKKYTIKN